MLIKQLFLPPESTITLADLFPNTDSKSTLRPAEGCGCATGEGVNPKKSQNGKKLKPTSTALDNDNRMENATNFHNINKANPSSKMFPKLPHLFVVMTFSITKSSHLTKKTYKRAAEIKLLLCFITGKKKSLLIFYLSICCILMIF